MLLGSRRHLQRDRESILSPDRTAFGRREKAVRAFALAPLVAVLGTSGHAQPLLINGKFGFLGEYELSATITMVASGRERSLMGPMTIRHVGLCSHDGPNESRGEIAIQLIDTKERISAAFEFDGLQCTYNGKLSQQNVGELRCSGRVIPFSIWLN
jgi:hypothetical protein